MRAAARFFSSAERLQERGDFRRAAALYEAAFHKAARQDHSLAAHAAQHAGDCRRQIEEFFSALRWYESASHYASTARLQSLKTDSLTGRAMALRGLELYAAAQRDFKKLIATYSRQNDREALAYLLWAVGTTHRFQGQFRHAEAALRKSLALYRRLKDKSGMAYARCGLGGTLRMRGDAAASGREYAAANSYFRKVGDRFGIAYSHCGQGNAARMRGDEKTAIHHMTLAETGYRTLKQKGPLAFVLWSRAQLDIRNGRILAARRRLSESGRLFKSCDDARGLIYVDLGFAMLEEKAGTGRMLSHARRAELAAQKTGLPFEQAHAIMIRTHRAPAARYRRCGVKPSFFRDYDALP